MYHNLIFLTLRLIALIIQDSLLLSLWLVFERIRQILHIPYDRNWINKLIKIVITQSRVVIALSRVIVIALSITCYRYCTVK